MIALLSYSMNLLASDNATNSSTGGLQQDSLCTDSVLISYCDLRKVNAKLIELDYERQISREYKDIISNDSIAISNLRSGILRLNSDYTRDIRNIKKQRNVFGGIGIVSIVLLIISIL